MQYYLKPLLTCKDSMIKIRKNKYIIQNVLQNNTSEIQQLKLKTKNYFLKNFSKMTPYKY